ncbi:hypothetical protein PHLCEN_2v906 [Hermanssonia centrifuga]|uniref:Uncharacterized protein n=1 Tax=Hermanssonia centrifuga TaxID=98765 RepID=A0A2R6S4Q6_9APHY|nr:hypothetical protein PHLCEN_2v906 [Hermanssonia centrifuga]
MAPKGTYDVRALPPDTHGDGSANPCALFQRAFIALSEIIADACDECLSVHTPPYATVLEADRRFQAWEAKLPAYLRWRTPSASVFDDPSQERPPAICEKDLQYQRHTLAAWYLNGLMNIHRPYLMHSPPILPPPGTAAGPRTRIMLNPSRKRCIEAALELTRVLCNFHDEAAAWTEPGGLNPGMAAYFVFDGAVALAGALSQTPPHPQSQECLGLMNKATRVLQELADSSQSIDGEGEMAKRGITVLMALRRAGGWDMNDAEKGELVLLQDILEAQQQQEQAPQNGTPGNQSNNPLASASVGMDIFHDISLLNHPVSNSATYGPQSTATDTLSTSAFIPYLSSPQFSRASPYSGPMSTSGQDNTPFSNLFSDMNIPFTASLGVSTSRLTQSMLMPFDVLQGVQPDSQGIGEFDLDWAKLAGMQSWYNNGAVPIDGSAGP